VILLDTSAWVEFLRATGSPVCERVDELLAGEILTCHPVRMEVLAGGRDERHVHNLRRLMARAVVLPTATTDYDDAAALYRRCRSNGESVRRMLDCLIAAVAIKARVPVLHLDRDFDTLARHTPLRLAEV
jgi:predicted nucleic acid-binding protein